MKTIALSLAFALLGALAVFLIYAWSPEELEAIEPPQAESFDPALVARGAELAALGNCLTCHQSEGGEPFAGGYAVQTPVGAIYGSNITPDPETGIGRWSEAAFVRSMHEGLDREGRHLFPAYPYTHFSIVPDEDARAIYAYLMTRRPVRNEVPDPELPFPLNVRALQAGWKLLFFEGPEPATPDPDDRLARGRHLVEGLGHCGACHTPRNLLMAESDDDYLQGAHAAGWYNPPLAGEVDAPAPWTAEEMTAYLTGGFADAHGVAAGPMAEVAGKLARAPRDDVAAMAEYVVSLQTGPSETASPDAAPAEIETGETGAERSAKRRLGETLYRSACLRCHTPSGQEASGTAAGSSQGLPLASSTALFAPEGTNLAQFILHGVQPPEGETGWPMPGFASLLTDEQIAAIAAYLREDLVGRPAWEEFADTLADARGGKTAN
ncbi:MAG: hypothetical protein CMP81_12500 [Fulvimarina sp.]|nr:hypothetical protein [Fulvimarina sp.]